MKYTLGESVGFHTIEANGVAIATTSNSDAAAELVRRANEYIDAMSSSQLAARVAAILREIYVEQPAAFKHAAGERNITVEQLAAAAIAEMIREAFGKGKQQ